MTEVANRFIISGWLLLSNNPKEKSKKSSLAAQLAERYTYSASGAFQSQLEQRFPKCLSMVPLSSGRSPSFVVGA